MEREQGKVHSLSFEGEEEAYARALEAISDDDVKVAKVYPEPPEECSHFFEDGFGKVRFFRKDEAFGTRYFSEQERGVWKPMGTQPSALGFTPRGIEEYPKEVRTCADLVRTAVSWTGSVPGKAAWDGFLSEIRAQPVSNRKSSKLGQLLDQLLVLDRDGMSVATFENWQDSANIELAKMVAVSSLSSSTYSNSQNQFMNIGTNSLPKKIFSGNDRPSSLDNLFFEKNKRAKIVGNDYYSPGRVVCGFSLPEWQRDLVWTEQQKIRFIESAYLGLHLGYWVVNAHDWDENGHAVKFSGILIDGQQRLNALDCYWNDEFSVYGLLWSQVSETDKRRFLRSPFPSTEISCWNEEDLREMYDRLNFGGTPHLENERAKKNSASQIKM